MGISAHPDWFLGELSIRRSIRTHAKFGVNLQSIVNVLPGSTNRTYDSVDYCSPIALRCDHDAINGTYLVPSPTAISNALARAERDEKHSFTPHTFPGSNCLRYKR